MLFRSKEVTSAVYWLIDNYKLDIKCVQVTPYHDAEHGNYYLQSTTILPVAGVENLLIGAAERTTASLAGPVKKDDVITSVCGVPCFLWLGRYDCIQDDGWRVG